MDALNAALQHEALMVKIGMHEGPCLAVVSNERLDYFGQTVNIAARVQGLATSRSIFVTEPIVQNEAVRELLADAGLEPTAHRTLLRGIAGELSVYEIPWTASVAPLRRPHVCLQLRIERHARIACKPVSVRALVAGQT
jgi:class 3 adenylate cyclase